MSGENSCFTRGRAFTFIASQEKTAPKSKCWLKKAGYHKGAEHATGTVSGVVRRE